MPSDTPKQARLISSDYGRAKAGKKTRTGMSAEQLREWVKADQQKKGKKKTDDCCPH